MAQKRVHKVCEYEVFNLPSVEQVSDTKPFKNRNQNVQNNQSKQTLRQRPGLGNATRIFFFVARGERTADPQRWVWWYSQQPGPRCCLMKRDEEPQRRSQPPQSSQVSLYQLTWQNNPAVPGGPAGFPRSSRGQPSLIPVAIIKSNLCAHWTSTCTYIR